MLGGGGQSSSAFPCEVKEIDFDVGCGLFATADVPGPTGGTREAHAVVLQETPLVFAPSFTHWRAWHDAGAASHGHGATDAPPPPLPSCFGCGAPLTTLAEELSRAARFADPPRSPESVAGVSAGVPCELIDRLFTRNAGDARGYLVALRADGQPVWARLCGPECRRRALEEEGKGLLLTPLTDDSVVDRCRLLLFPPDTDAEDAALRFPSPAQVLALHAELGDMAAAQWRRVWSSRLCVASTVLHVAAACSERVWLLLLLLARLLQRCRPPGAAPGAAEWAARLRTEAEAVRDGYAEGAMHSPNREQRALLIFAWRLSLWWVALCFADEQASEPQAAEALAAAAEALPLQLYLQLQWALNANAHMYVVASPVYSLWCRYYERLGERAPEEGREATHLAPAEASAAAALYGFFADVFAAQADLMHSRVNVVGCALYGAATKINHSCAPSVRFFPNDGAVMADVRALRRIAAGEQLFTSYIDVEFFRAPAEEGSAGDDEERARLRRRRFLLKHYGFECRCALCEP